MHVRLLKMLAGVLGASLILAGAAGVAAQGPTATPVAAPSATLAPIPSSTPLAIPTLAQPPTPTPLAADLTQIAYDWDLGLSMKFPAQWPQPRYLAGQMILAATLDSMIGIPTQPVIALRIVDPISELRLPRDATLEQIAAAASLGQNVKIDATGPTQISIFDAGFVNLTLSSDTGRIIGQATAFRILDGRVAVLTGLAPTGIWADFVPTYENMRGSVARLKPSDYTPPRIGGKIGKFPQGGLQFAIPDGWIERDVTGQNARLYHDAALTDTLDRSGFNNGPQFVVQASQFAKDTTLKDALRQAIQAGPQDIITDVTAGGQPAAQHSFIDSSTGQTVTFVGVASADRNVLNIIRWSAPGLLDEATRPTFQAMLASVKFSDITATLVPQPTPRQ